MQQRKGKARSRGWLRRRGEESTTKEIEGKVISVLTRLASFTSSSILPASDTDGGANVQGEAVFEER